MTTFYYSPSVNGFYNSDVYAAENLPLDAISLSKERYEELRDGQSGVKRIALNANGVPALVDVVVDDEQMAANRERYWRDTEIARIQWLRERHRDELELSSPTSLTAEQYVELLAYLQLLRDWPQSDNFPDQDFRPVKPEWIVEQINP
ncbi:phage tail assembly chaperone [Pseudomonas moorei]|uniref:phage tail assembly chaperone n=1 Tax=Pseudomonas moorei TaxID=395599 RepID=UPI0020102478|nr:phage tail assembly chaperone [Pseudomonas moorei]